jgi:thioredoxin-related protein
MEFCIFFKIEKSEIKKKKQLKNILIEHFQSVSLSSSDNKAFFRLLSVSFKIKINDHEIYKTNKNCNFLLLHDQFFCLLQLNSLDLIVILADRFFVLKDLQLFPGKKL